MVLTGEGARTLSSLWLLTKKVLTGGMIGITISDKWLSVASVRGDSMQPTLVPFTPSPLGSLGGDILLVEKLCLAEYKFSHGDVIIFRFSDKKDLFLLSSFSRSPSDHKRTMVKRLIALPGDWIKDPESHDIIKVPEGHCWVEGDNSTCSFDSRAFGPIPLGLVKGRVTSIVWPPQRIRKVERRTPMGRVSSI